MRCGHYYPEYSQNLKIIKAKLVTGYTVLSSKSDMSKGQSLLYEMYGMYRVPMINISLHGVSNDYMFMCMYYNDYIDDNLDRITNIYPEKLKIKEKEYSIDWDISESWGFILRLYLFYVE